jgi:plastocyanin
VRSLGFRSAAAVAAAVLTAGCADLDPTALAARQVPGAAVTVHIVDSPETVGAFQPAVARIQPGQTVAWVNASGDYHTVTFDDRSVRSSAGFATGATFQRTFDRPGVYRYVCVYHPGMVGEVVVGGEAASPARSP